MYVDGLHSGNANYRLLCVFIYFTLRTNMRMEPMTAGVITPGLFNAERCPRHLAEIFRGIGQIKVTRWSISQPEASVKACP